MYGSVARLCMEGLREEDRTEPESDYQTVYVHAYARTHTPFEYYEYFNVHLHLYMHRICSESSRMDVNSGIYALTFM